MMSANKKKYAFLGAVFAVCVAIDQITKRAILNRFVLGESLEIVPGLFSLTYVRNKGAAFGFLHSAPESFREPFFLAVPILAIFILGYLYYQLRVEERLSAWALSLILSGAAGNLIDRVRFGYVVDFLDFYLVRWGHWPAFNVADMAIVIGVSLLFLHSLLGRKVVAG